MAERDRLDDSDSGTDTEEIPITITKKISVCNRQLVAAIDFGTAYSGYAYSFKHEWTKIITQHWHGGDYLTHKATTSLLLKPDGSFFKFGFEAENEYASLSEDDNHKDYFFFRRFKLILKPKLTEVRGLDLNNMYFIEEKIVRSVCYQTSFLFVWLV